MTIWQYLAAVDGVIQANSVEDKNTLSKKEADDIWKYLEAKGNA